MTFLHTVLHGKKRLLLEALCLLTGLVFTLLMTWTTSLFFWDSVVFGSRSMQISETYLAIPQFFLPLGSGMFALQFFAELLRTLAGLFGGSEENLPEEAVILGR
jgi:TRAP-type C4-dicarboxylate transport system permease small subunit